VLVLVEVDVGVDEVEVVLAGGIAVPDVVPPVAGVGADSVVDEHAAASRASPPARKPRRESGGTDRSLPRAGGDGGARRQTPAGKRSARANTALR
jgi:hypothetical protein